MVVCFRLVVVVIVGILLGYQAVTQQPKRVPTDLGHGKKKTHNQQAGKLHQSRESFSPVCGAHPPLLCLGFLLVIEMHL